MALQKAQAVDLKLSLLRDLDSSALKHVFVQMHLETVDCAGTHLTSGILSKGENIF